MRNKVSPNANNEDGILFQLAKQRDKDAFTRIYNKYHQYLYILAYRFLKDSEMAQDVVQYIFVKLWDTSRDIDVEINLKNYLYTMTKNHILNLIRDNKETISINYQKAQIDIPDDSADILKMLEETQLTTLLYEGIETLPPQKKEICKKKIEDNKSNQQIADEMGLSVNTVKVHYQESVKMLKKYFNQIKMLLF